MHPGPALFMPTLGGMHICTNGPVWSAKTIPSGRYSGLVYLGSSTWVATGHGQAGVTPIPTAISINDGATWASSGGIPNSTNSTPASLCYAPLLGANGRLMAYTESQATTLYSDDKSVTWSQQVQATVVPCDLKFGNGLFVNLNTAGANTYSSADGLIPFALNATPAQGASIHWIDAAGWWLLIERGGLRTWTSPDLATWTLRGNLPFAGNGITTANLAQNGLNLVAVSNDGAITTAALSADGGVTWTQSGNIVGDQFNCIGFGNGIFFVSAAAGQGYVSSDNGATWAASASSLTLQKTWLYRHDGLNTWVAVGANTTDDTVANQGLC